MVHSGVMSVFGGFVAILPKGWMDFLLLLGGYLCLK